MIESKNFRGALALDDIRVLRNRDRQPVRVTFNWLGEVGYTPMRHQVGSQVWFQYFDLGRGSAHRVAACEGTRVDIDCWVRFKIGALGDLGCLVLTGTRAPSAMLRIHYQIDCESAQVEFFGTALPSQSYYTAWNRNGLHDMLTIPSGAIDRFLEAGACKDAFCRRHEIWNGPVISGPCEKQ